MSNNLPNADVWVIHQEMALLFQQRDEKWRQEMSISWPEFIGSAVGLSSFALPNTHVYLNLKTDANEHNKSQGMHWVGLQKDPLRLIQIHEKDSHQSQLRDLAAMGKKALPIFTQQPENFQNSIALTLMHTQEIQHTRKWVDDQQQRNKPTLAALVFFGRLLFKARPDHQSTRIALLLCAVLCSLVWQCQATHTLQTSHSQSIQTFQQQLLNKKPPATQHSFKNWALLIRKFGAAERANLNSFILQWNEQGHVHTLVQMHRERKRVPKGCSLIAASQAICSLYPDTGPQKKQ